MSILVVIINTVFFLLVVGLYCYGLFSAIRLTLAQEPSRMPAPLSRVLEIVGGFLGLNLGSVLGLSAAGVGLYADVLLLRTVTEAPPFTLIQVAAAVIYAIVLVITIGFWACTNFAKDPNRIVRDIVTIAEQGIGIAIAAFALTLGIQPS